MKESILTIDVGTQSIRAAVVIPDGEILGIAQIPQDADCPHAGWAQQRPEAWWAHTAQAIRKVLTDVGLPAGGLAAVSVCGQMHGPVGVDEAGQVTTEWTQLWCDKRCSGECWQVRQSANEQDLSARTGNPINPAWTAFKVRWIKNNQPDVYLNSKWFLVPKDFINFRLTGVPATDPSEASGSFLWDCTAEAYSDDLADVLGVDLNKFAPALPSHQVIGTVTKAASTQTGLPDGVPVVAGGGDFPVSMLGFGIVGEGVAADITGTSSLLAVHTAQPIIHPAIQNLRHVVPGWVAFTILDCGGLSMKWCKSLISSARQDDATYDLLMDMAATVPPGSHGLIFYPYMLGERKSANTDAHGCFFGVSLDHRAAHFVRAVMEGTAYALAKDLELLRRLGGVIDRVQCGGGATRNTLWSQIKADVLQMPLEISTEPEAGIRGAALLGAAGVGLIKDLAHAARHRSRSADCVEPDGHNALGYRRATRQFRRIYDHMLGFWQRDEDVPRTRPCPPA